MKKIRFALIGSGWRAEFYIRIAKQLPALFDLTGVMIRDPEKARAFSEKFTVPTVNSLDALLSNGPDFVVVCVKRGALTDCLIELMHRGVPALCETPPGESEEALLRVWEEAQTHRARVQVAEQYFAQPLYAAWYEAIRQGSWAAWRTSPCRRCTAITAPASSAGS